jgi:predicted nucleic acid-binding Zn ribbon protein
MTELTKDCFVCGKEIVNKRIDAKYCSNLCGNKFRNKNWIKLNPEKVKRRRIREFELVAVRILKNVRYKCKKFNIPFNLELSDISVPETCPVLGIKLVWNYGKGAGFHDNSPSIDRIDPNGGYVKGNVRIISARANLLKNNAYVEELELILEDLKRIGRWQKSGC